MNLLFKSIFALVIPIAGTTVLLDTKFKDLWVSDSKNESFVGAETLDAPEFMDGDFFEVQAVKRGTIVNKVVSSGAVLPRHEVAIHSRVSGVIKELAVAPGDFVKRGQLIARIHVVADPMQLNAALADVRVAGMEVNHAWRIRNRSQELLERSLIAKSAYEKTDTDYRIKVAQLQSMKRRLEIVQNGNNTTLVEPPTEVRATVRGTVLRVFVREGNTVTESNNLNEGTKIAAIGDLQDMVFKGTVEEANAGLLEKGMPLRVNIGALPGITFDGELEYVSPIADKSGGPAKFDIRASITQTFGKLIRAGYTANADIVLQRRDNVLTFDEGALLFSGEKTFVYAKPFESVNVDDAELRQKDFRKTEVSVGMSDGIQIEALSGLHEGDLLQTLR